MLIPIITEPSYRKSSIWCANIRTGIEAELSRKKYDTIEIDGAALRTFDYGSLPSGKPPAIVLIGTSPSWIPEAIDFFAGQKIDVVLVSYQPPETAPVRAVLRIDYVAGTHTLLHHLEECGCTKTALYGCFVNSSADMIKYRVFCETVGAEHSFDNRGSLADCYEQFLPRIKDYDSVICVNDIVAASLINRLKRDGIRVPEDIQIVCFGSSEISRLYRPSITALTLDNAELGRQAVSIFSYLSKSDPSINISVRIGGKLIVRSSSLPCGAAPKQHGAGQKAQAALNFYADEEVKAFTMLENLLTLCDDLDKQILTGLLADSTTEHIAENLSLAPETVRYRIRRILQNIGMKSRGELVAFIRGNNFGEVLEGRM